MSQLYIVRDENEDLTDDERKLIDDEYYQSIEDQKCSKNGDKWLIAVYALLLLAATGLIFLVKYLTALSSN